MVLTEFHFKFPGSVRWRVSPKGVEIEGQGLVPVSFPAKVRCQKLVRRYRAEYAAAARASGVAVELLVACSLTESAPVRPESSIRVEPFYVSDEETPNRISAGFCQLLISTAREVMGDPAIGRDWLLNVENSLAACAAFIRRQSPVTGFDPVYVACAYNSGGLYLNDEAGNRWRLRQFPLGTGKHADRFAEYFTAICSQTPDPFAGISCPRYASLLD